MVGSVVVGGLSNLELVIFSRCWKFRKEGGRLKTGLDCDRIRANSTWIKSSSVLSILSIAVKPFQSR